jgi:hypothetical protein
MAVTPAYRLSALVAAGLALAVGLHSHGTASSPRAAAVAPGAARAGLSGTTDAEARQLRRATRLLDIEVAAAARCRPRGLTACATPALRHTGMGGRTTGMLVRSVIAGVPQGRCRMFLFRLGVANDGASDEARWLLPRLYEPGHTLEIHRQLVLMARMLRGAWRSARANVCSPTASMPAA